MGLVRTQTSRDHSSEMDTVGTQEKIAVYTSVKKHFIKMLKDLGMVVPKIKETRL